MIQNKMLFAISKKYYVLATTIVYTVSFLISTSTSILSSSFINIMLTPISQKQQVKAYKEKIFTKTHLKPSLENGIAVLGDVKIIQKRIPITETRIKLTEEYAAVHYGFKTAYMENPKVIVVHWTGGGTVQSVYNYFYPETVKNGSWHEKYGKLNVGAHFLVDRDGTIYQLFNETFITRHCIGMNYHAIGIENIGGKDGMDDLTDQQLNSNIALIKHLKEKYPTIKLVIGHYEYRKYEGTEYFLELLPDYRNVKMDPGKRFMDKIRAGIE
jgi:hypothetical protein